MVFVGKDAISQNITGYLGTNNLFVNSEEIKKTQVFESVPWIRNDQVVLHHQVYQYQNTNQAFRLLYSVDEGEVLMNGLQNQGSVKSVITSKNLYIFNSIDYDNDVVPLKALLKIPLPGDYNNLWDAQISEVDDGFIISFLYGKSNRHDIYLADQLTYKFDLSGQVKLMNKRNLIQNPPMLIKDLEYFISPAWKLALDYFPLHPSRDRYLDQRPQVKTLSQGTLKVLIVLAIIYASMTVYLSKNRNITTKNKVMWAILNSILGLPGIISFVFLNQQNNHISEVQLSLHENNKAQHV
jgi:hypothetical protein